jgi:hypothetical protein
MKLLWKKATALGVFVSPVLLCYLNNTESSVDGSHDEWIEVIVRRDSFSERGIARLLFLMYGVDGAGGVCSRE